MVHSEDDFFLFIWDFNQFSDIDGLKDRNLRSFEIEFEAIEYFMVTATLVLHIPDHRVEKLLQRAILKGHEITWQSSVLIGE